MDDELYEAFNKASGHPWLDCTGAYVAEAQTPEAQWKQDQREHSEGSVLSPSDQERITEHADAALSAAPADLSSRETRGGPATSRQALLADATSIRQPARKKGRNRIRLRPFFSCRFIKHRSRMITGKETRLGKYSYEGVAQACLSESQ